MTLDGVTYFVVAERPDCDLAEFTVSDDLSTVALLWNLQGGSELQILEYTDYTLGQPIPLPGPVASELSISAGGSMVAMTVEGPACRGPSSWSIRVRANGNSSTPNAADLR